MLNEVVNHGLVSLFFLLAAFFKLKTRQWENVFSRLVISVWYFYVFIHPQIGIETQRLFGRWSIMQLAVIEVLSYAVRAWLRQAYSRAMEGIRD